MKACCGTSGSCPVVWKTWLISVLITTRRQGLSVPLYRWENRGSEVLSDLPNVTQLLSRRVRILIEACPIPTPKLFLKQQCFPRSSISVPLPENGPGPERGRQKKTAWFVWGRVLMEVFFSFQNLDDVQTSFYHLKREKFQVNFSIILIWFIHLPNLPQTTTSCILGATVSCQ